MNTEVAICIAGNVDSGKCFGKGTQILKYDGSIISVELIKKDDIIMGDDSTPRVVLETHNDIGRLYSISFLNKKYFVNGSHILTLKHKLSDRILFDNELMDYTLKYLTKQNNKFTLITQKYKPSEIFNKDEIFVRSSVTQYYDNIQNRIKNGEIIEMSVYEYLKLDHAVKNTLYWYKAVVDYIDRPAHESVNIHKLMKNLGEYKYNSLLKRIKLINTIYNIFGNNDLVGMYKITIPIFGSKCDNDLIYILNSSGYHVHNVIFNNGFMELMFNNEIEYEFQIEAESIGEYYGFSTNGNHRFLLSDFSVVHNSTFVGVMAFNELDNGNGSARIKVAKHPHEIESKKTSAISTHVVKCDDGKHGVTFIDLCGHEKYLKTTTFGINGYYPDYAFIIVAANRGIMKMTREHLGILFYLDIPTVIIISRVDLVIGNSVYNDNLNMITKICKMNKKQPVIVNTDKEFMLPQNEQLIKEQEAINTVIKLSNKMNESSNIIPIITISCKTGYYLNTIRSFINNVRPRKLWDVPINGSIFYIDHVFSPVGVGIVVSGILKGKSVKINDTLYIGPNNKEFIMVRIKSIHNDNKEEITELKNHQRGCLAITNIDKKVEFGKHMIKKGFIGVYPESFTEKICYTFKAEIDILHHSTTINSGYSPFIHAGTICQTAKLTITVDETNKKDSLRTGDCAIVTFKFRSKPEFLETFAETGNYIFFREGTTRGRGKVLEIVKLSDDPEPYPDVERSRRNRKNKPPNKPPKNIIDKKNIGEKKNAKKPFIEKNGDKHIHKTKK